MATIEYNGHIPSAFLDKDKGYHNDEAPTNVDVTALVTNTGNADGFVRLRLGLRDPLATIRRQEDVELADDIDWGGGGADTEFQIVLFESTSYGASNETLFEATIRIPDDLVRTVVAELWSRDGGFYESATYTVNSYIEPTPDLGIQQQITFNVR